MQDEFLSGCRLSFEMVMKCFASGSVDDVAACMTERMKNGYQQVEASNGAGRYLRKKVRGA